MVHCRREPKGKVLSEEIVGNKWLLRCPLPSKWELLFVFGGFGDFGGLWWFWLLFVVFVVFLASQFLAYQLSCLKLVVLVGVGGFRCFC